MTEPTRSLIFLNGPAKRGEWLEVRCTLAHPMESGHRRGSDGQLLPRNIVETLVCRFKGALIAQFRLHAAIAANPFVSFGFVPQQSGTLELRWQGQNGFFHAASREVVLI